MLEIVFHRYLLPISVVVGGNMHFILDPGLYFLATIVEHKGFLE